MFFLCVVGNVLKSFVSREHQGAPLTARLQTKPPHICAAALPYRKSVLLVLSVLIILLILVVLIILIVLVVLIVLVILLILVVLIVLIVLIVLVILIVIHTDMLLFSSEKIFFIFISDGNEYELSAVHSFEFPLSDKHILY